METAHRQLFTIIKNVMECTENDRAAASLLKLLSVDGVRVDPLIANQCKEHLVVLFLNCIV